MFLSVALILALQARPPATNAPKPEVKPAAIHGKVTSAENGQPLKRALVTVRPSSRILESQTISTDAQGEFDLKNIEPGTYTLTAARTGYVTMGWKAKKPGQPSEQLKLAEDQTVKDLVFMLPRGAVISGAITDEDGEPMGGVQVQAMIKSYRQGKAKLQTRGSVQSDDRGNYRLYDLSPGRYYVQAGGKNLMAVATEGGMAAAPPYATLIYPGATKFADAQSILVAAGAEVGGINLMMRSASTYTVSGKIMDLRSAKPVSNAVIMVSGGEDMINSLAGQTQTRADGSFRITGVYPGQYSAMVVNVDSMSSGSRNMIPIMRSFEVSNSNITDFNINIGPGATVKGKITADGGSIPNNSRAALMPKSGVAMPGGFVTVNADGTFEMADVQPGTYELSVGAMSASNPASNYYIRELHVGDQDVVETGLRVPEGIPVIEMSAVLDFHGGNLSGTAVDEENQPMNGAHVVLLAADARKRSDRYFHRAGTDSTGAFKFNAIIPGDYLLVIWPEDEPGQLMDPDVILQVEKHATRVSVQGDGTTNQNLKLTKELRTIAQTFSQ